MTEPNENYISLLTSQYQNSTNFKRWLETVLDRFHEISELSDAMPSYFDIDTAVGVQLDSIGALMGQGRTLAFEPTDGSPPYLDDATYRKILKLKAFYNYWDGQFKSIYEGWAEIFPEVSLIITDNQDMTADITITGELSQIVIDLINNDLMIPRPQGVKYNYSGTVEVAPIFAFDYEEGESPYFEGFDIGYWDSTFI
jgi:hypothetical protein